MLFDATCRPESALSDALFDPMDALLQDAVADSELVPDFIDRLLDSQPLAGPSLVVTLPIDVPGATAMPEAAEEEEEDYMPSSSKRHRTSSHGSMFGNNEFVGSPMGSPVSTLDMGAQFLPVAAPKGGARHAKAASLKENKEGRDGSTGGSLSRKNKPQRCSICKECGHKSRTCRFAQTAVDVPPLGAVEFGGDIS